MNIKSITALTLTSFLLTGCFAPSSDDSATTETPVDETPVVTTESCTLTGLPQYGTIDFTSEVWAVRNKELPSTSNQDFDLNLVGNDYGFFAYPIALGEATFYDRDILDISGAWDGATWTPYAFDPEVHTTYEPIITEVDGTKYYVYRTDFYGIGDRTFGVEFANAGMAIGTTTTCDVSQFTFVASFNDMDIQELETPVDETPVDETPVDEIPDGMCVASAMPRFGTNGTNIWTEEEVDALPNTLTTLEQQEFVIDVDSYGFFAYPAAYGTATFIDVAVEIQGGWDGAAWGEEFWNASRNTPIIVQVDGTDWFVYRTDFSGLGNRTYRVSFENSDVALNDVVPCDTSLYPSISQGLVDGDLDINSVSVYSTGTIDSPLMTGNAFAGVYEINVTHLADGTYDIYFSSDSLTYGPTTITVVDGEIEQTQFDSTTMNVVSN